MHHSGLDCVLISLTYSVARSQQPLVVLVVGASGDLAKKKTYPALFELWHAKLFPATTIIWGFARSKNSHEGLREHLKGPLMNSIGDDATESEIDDFLRLCYYNSGSSYGDDVVMHEILSGVGDKLHNLLVYLAIPPHVFGESTLALKKALSDLTVPGFTRIVLEKPFGRDTESCNELLQTLRDQEWQESALYRIDHYLGKEMVQNILALRENNPFLKVMWNRELIQSVHIVFKEPITTYGRGGYFDPYGIVRDILQNHLMQVMTLVAMDLPEKMTNDSIRDAKVNVIKSMPEIVLDDCLFGQYEGYREDPTIENRETITATYACIRTWVNTDTWRGVPFVFEAGKALDERLCEVRLHFRGNTKNALVLRLQPTPAVFLTANMKTPGFSKSPVSTHIGVDYGHADEPGAYTRLLLDVCRGEQANFVRDDELLESWKIFTPVLQQVEREHIEPQSYEEGSTGPDSRSEFLKSMGVTQAWLPPPSAL